MSRQFFEYHPIYAYRFIPEQKVRVPHEAGGYLLRTNAQGFRCNHDFTPQRNGEKRRILLFGDSFTAGDGVSNGKRYGDLLEELVPNCEVYNFGLSGSGTDQQYLIYQHDARERAIEHDLMVIGVLVENIRRVAAKYRTFTDEKGVEKVYAKPYFELEVQDGCEHPVLHGVPVPKEPLSSDAVDAGAIDRGGRFHQIRGMINRLGLKEAAQRLTSYQPLPHYNDPNKHEWRLMRAILFEWITQHDKPVLLFPIPLYQYVEKTSDPDHYVARFQELARDASCALCDPLPTLWEYDKATRRRFRFEKDVHPTEQGHQALARALVPDIERLLAASQSSS